MCASQRAGAESVVGGTPTLRTTYTARMKRLLRYAWASPATLIGLCLALAAGAVGATATVVDGVLEVAGGAGGRWCARWPFSAITFGHVVLGVDAETLARCRAHERAHVRQYERWGIVFFPLYGGSSLWAALRGRRPYWDNRFEREARERCAARPS